MKKSDIYEIAIKILGLYLVIKVLGLLKEVLTMFIFLLQTKNNSHNSLVEFDQTPIFLVTLFNFFLVAVFAAILIFNTKKIAKLICKKADYEENSKLFTEKKTIYEMVLTIVGLLTIIIAVPELAITLKTYIHLFQYNSSKNNDLSFMIIAGLKIIIGITVVFYSKSISNYLAKSKTENKE